jgi:ribosomal protein L29
MDLKSIREKQNDDLAVHMRELEEQVFRIRCTVERLTPQKGGQIRALRREIAQVKTVIGERGRKHSAK